MGSCNSRNDCEPGKPSSWNEKSQYISLRTSSDEIPDSDTEFPGGDEEETNSLLHATEKEVEEEVPWDDESLKIPSYFRPQLIADLKRRLEFIQNRYNGMVHRDVIWKLQKMLAIAFVYRMKEVDGSGYEWEDVPKKFLFCGPSDAGRLSIAENIAVILHNFGFLNHKAVTHHILDPEKCHPVQNATKEVKRQWDLSTERVLLLDIKNLGKNYQICHAVADELVRLIKNMKTNKAVTVILDANMDQIDRMALHNRDFNDVFGWKFSFKVPDLGAMADFRRQ
ncbi:hypothetical protein BZA77DRAFT_346485 [Pyronema omphalodes]|nr:hypothetical protein BZA77DRAFT_346485 [Pyronema omphalodes]